MYAEEEQLRDFLLDAGILSRSQLDAAVQMAEDSGTPLSRVLIETGVLGEDEVRRAMARGLGIPFVRFTPDEVSTEALATIPEALARARGLVAYKVGDGILEVALLDIGDLEALEPLQLHTKYKILPRLTDRESMTRALLHYQKNLKDLFGARIAREASMVAAVQQNDDYAVVAERLPVRGVVDALIGHALYQQASAMYIEPREANVLVRYRIGTSVYDAMHIPMAAVQSVILRLKFLAQLQLGTAAPQEGRFRVGVGNEHEYVSVHVSTVPVVGAVYGEKVALHIMHEQVGRRGFTLDSLGFSVVSRQTIHKTLSEGRGLFLVCGPAGAGKTTLLYTLLDMLSNSGKSLASVEDKVELYLPFVAQTTVADDVGLSFAAALRAVLRQDPNVVMVGNIRDAETALLALEAANRGALVLAGVTAATAAKGVQALLDFGVSPLTLAATLRASVGLRVVRKLCPKKHVPQRLMREDVDVLETQADFARILALLKAEHKVDAHTLWKDIAFFRAEPCSQCRGGYQGTLGLQEVMSTSEVLKELVSREESFEVLEAAAREEGMLTLVEDGIAKAAQGQTTIEEVVEVAQQQ